MNVTSNSVFCFFFVFLREAESTGEGLSRIKGSPSPSSLSLPQFRRFFKSRGRGGEGSAWLRADVPVPPPSPHWQQQLLSPMSTPHVALTPLSQNWKPSERMALFYSVPEGGGNPVGRKCKLEGKVRPRKWEGGSWDP